MAKPKLLIVAGAGSAVESVLRELRGGTSKRG